MNTKLALGLAGSVVIVIVGLAALRLLTPEVLPSAAEEPTVRAPVESASRWDTRQDPQQDRSTPRPPAAQQRPADERLAERPTVQVPNVGTVPAERPAPRRFPPRPVAAPADRKPRQVKAEPSPEKDKKLTAVLMSELQTIRSQLELYKVQHHGRYPHLDGARQPDVQNFIARLISKTDQDGTLNDSGRFGPYLIRFPKNPFNKSNTVRFGDGKDLGAGPEGWYFNTKTGKLSANDPAHKGP